MPDTLPPAVVALRRYLEERRLSARALAIEAGLEPRTLSNWVRGVASPRAAAAATLQRATGGAVRADAW